MKKIKKIKKTANLRFEAWSEEFKKLKKLKNQGLNFLFFLNYVLHC